jgi:NAD(P)-dependent dehydrogenase (short-subunit alcohol dehydrogenase family)
VIQAFLVASAVVSAVDINKAKMTLKHDRLHWQVADVTSEDALGKAFHSVEARHGVIAVCVALAWLDLSYLPHRASILDMTVDQWRRTFKTNVEGTFMTSRMWPRSVDMLADATTRNLSVVIIGSEAGTFGVTGNADYGASKSAVQYGFVQSLVKDVVNASSGKSQRHRSRGGRYALVSKGMR